MAKQPAARADGYALPPIERQGSSATRIAASSPAGGRTPARLLGMRQSLSITPAWCRAMDASRRF
ncbi:MAG: hypothetical protein WA821_23915 [Anaerolineales bacterium]